MSEYFTPIAGLTGGSLIGLSAGTLLLLNGDVLGASGIMSSPFTTPSKTFTYPSQFWKLALLSSFSIASTYLLGPQFLNDERTQNDSNVPMPSEMAYVLAGLLVGFGTKLGNGCTSGHGVCGLGRQSIRSFTAVMSFMASAILTVWLTSPSSVFANLTDFLRRDEPSSFDATAGTRFTTLVVTLSLIGYRLSQKNFRGDDRSKIFGAVFVGALFAAGLAVSQMVVASKLFGFLDIGSITSGKWDPTLATVMGAAVVVSTGAYQAVQGYSLADNKQTFLSPLMASKFCLPSTMTVDTQLVVGAAIFGVGWALGLLCPAPALYHAANGNLDVLFRWFPAFVVGSVAAQQVKR